MVHVTAAPRPKVPTLSESIAEFQRYLETLSVDELYKVHVVAMKAGEIVFHEFLKKNDQRLREIEGRS